jgi:hypothetical protein
MSWGNPDDPVKLWRAQADRLERERAEAKERMRRSEERRERDVARVSAHAEIAALKERLAAAEQQLEGFNEFVQAVATFGDAASNKLAKLEELLTRHAELREAESRQSKGFQGFAREKSDTEVVDLPDFIRKMH